MPLPDHLEKDIADFVEKASHEGFDKVSGRKFEERSKNTRDGYRAALRYLLTTLGKAGVPIAKMNRLETVLTDANIIEAVRWTAEHIDDVNSISNRTAAQCFGAIVTVAARNDVDVDDMFQTVRKSAFLAEGAAMSKEMCGSTLRISRRVVEDKEARRLFFSLHKIFGARAEAILASVGGHVKDLATDDFRTFLMFGTLAAFCAIQTEGAPERKMSVLKLRVRGRDANMLMPNMQSDLWSFKLSAIDTKTREARPLTDVERAGTETLNWYYATVCPHLKGDRPSPYMFPAPEAEGHMRQQTFDGWIARATSAVGMRMTAHKFRCVQASILLHIDWNNLLIAAHLVGNTPKTCATFYGWINEEDLMSKAQAARGRAKAEVEECVETYE